MQTVFWFVSQLYKIMLFTFGSIQIRKTCVRVSTYTCDQKSQVRDWFKIKDVRITKAPVMVRCIQQLQPHKSWWNRIWFQIQNIIGGLVQDPIMEKDQEKPFHILKQKKEKEKWARPTVLRLLISFEIEGTPCERTLTDFRSKSP